MVVTIPDLLTAEQIEAVCSVVRQGQFIDGRLSAGKDASPQKNNLELSSDADRFEALNSVVMTALVQHPQYLQAAMPAKISAPIYARYLAGMEYGGHIDDPIMGAHGSRYRSDISITVFLNSADEYEGGELCIDSSQGGNEYKLPAGYALLYPSTRYHAVNQVTAGERLVAITWVQSYIRSAEQREILLQLDQARASLASDIASPTYQKINLCYANLFRMWADA
ncbi:MAG: Fe2+-dependent dioxygenase [Gammaproteobacteria bacterium]|nr:Fe2+-dependent dioxygenase [Gammaproteobacteria bacterium]